MHLECDTLSLLDVHLSSMVEDRMELILTLQTNLITWITDINQIMKKPRKSRPRPRQLRTNAIIYLSTKCNNFYDKFLCQYCPTLQGSFDSENTDAHITKNLNP